MKAQMLEELTGNILPFWREKMTDTRRGGFYGRIDGQGNLDAAAEKGAILNARILWAFSAACRVLRRPEYLETAMRAFDYVADHFIDPVYGGVYWSLDCEGHPVDRKKQSYAIGFTIYGLSEFVRAFQAISAAEDHAGLSDKEYETFKEKSSKALEQAQRLFHDIESHAFDAGHNGYIEALSEDWKPIADMRLSDKDENGSRTMNTHLHIIEPYTNLLRVWPDARLRERVENLIHIFVHRLLNADGHLDLFFNDEWQGRRNIQSYGHDIEASWLLNESLLVLQEHGTYDEADQLNKAIVDIAKAADKGLRQDGAMIYEHWMDSGKTDDSLQWWVQCENVIGHVNLYQYHHDEAALAIAADCWRYIDEHIVDKERGEWLWSVDADGTPNYTDDKAGFWKCPYHNTRMCLEIIERQF